MDTTRHEGKGNGDQLHPTSRRNPGSGSFKKYNKDLSTTKTHLYCLYTLFASRVNQSPLTYGSYITKITLVLVIIVVAIMLEVIILVAIILVVMMKVASVLVITIINIATKTFLII
ncbi:hypothetical protein EDEG_04201 [Edhazardia aedis USNM 41457]|uniref:Uncharacterized protein n=1 Tax=Edhazardia aedis (strain USNM 41457) TaxID=1003232 RepID=J9DB43_EDHAE|nr:hypothetical protein EDEG_04201 [Edhazardia aedis USNM 41457]|eukprot:EJW04714.1 hypothetical protein EDEG_04201 [Edhazardia aedis USNM 41457]